MSLRAFLVPIVALLSIASFSRAHHPHDPAPPKGPLVQVALLLDTSNSMDGLINQARTQLWTIVNEFSRCRRDGKVPRLQVALYEYGNDRLSPGEGFIRMVLPFTDDLDKVSEKLFALTTCGGSEFCGHVIQSATRELKWSDEPGTFKAIFIAGNEPFTQGSVDYRDSCKRAIGKGIVVNTIHCGNPQDGITGMWKDGAALAEGRWMNINQDHCVAAISAPQDKQLAELSVELNVTYIPYGPAGAMSCARQEAQDKLASENAAAGTEVQRAVAKASDNYRNAGWDLCDAVKEGKLKLDAVDAKDLPESMQKLSIDERRAYVDARVKQRAELQTKINSLNAEREKYVAEQRKQQAGAPETLDSAMLKAMREQMKEKGFEVGEVR
jgi:hypothetical protein